MANKKLLKYIKVNINNGATEQQIKKALLDAGWDKQDIEEAWVEFNKPDESEELKMLPKDKYVESKTTKTLWMLLFLGMALLVIGVVVYVVYNSSGQVSV